MDKVVFELSDGVAYLTLNRPEAMNAMDQTLLEELAGLIRRCYVEPEARVLVLRGNGRAFSAGGDVKWMQATKDNPAWEEEFHSLVGRLNQVIMLLRNLNKPVLAQIHGFASGAGFSLALACDLRLAAAGTKFNQAYVNLGLTPDGGSTYFLTMLLGPARALDLIYSGRVLEAGEALALGLLNEVLPEDALESRVREVAGQLATGPAIAYGQAKELVYAAQMLGLAEQLKLERQSIVEASLSSDFREGLASFAEKRKPSFKGA